MATLIKRTGVGQITLTVYIVLAWFFLALGLTLAGVFYAGSSQPAVALGVAVVLPVVLFLLIYRFSSGFRRFARSISPTTLVMLQFYRTLGIFFIILTSRQQLPPQFALPAGLGDATIGLLAPLVALIWSSGSRAGRLVFILWNILGLADLVTAVSLGTTTGPGGIISTSISTSLMTVFPLSLIPTFLVPISIILHILALQNLRTERAV